MVNTAQLPAHQLLDVLYPPQGAASPTDAQAATALTNFLNLLVGIDAKHTRKQLSLDYLASQVFSKTRLLHKDSEKVAYCRSHLNIAVRQLRLLINQVSSPLTLSSLEPYSSILRDYIFDLGEVVPFLERNNPGFVYLSGGKNSNVHSWEVYLLSRGLIYQSAFRGSGPQFDHKTAQITAIFALRQALELRFERLVSVYPIDKNGRGPKLRHGFHQKFITTHTQYFDAPGVDFPKIQKVYDWCSEVVHLAYQPFAWQTEWALEIAEQLLRPRKPVKGQAWNIAGSVEIIDVVAMQDAYEVYFLENYDHGSWRMMRHRPEALIKNWHSSMQMMAPDYRSAGLSIAAKRSKNNNVMSSGDGKRFVRWFAAGALGFGLGWIASTKRSAAQESLMARPNGEDG
ncbi:hypothetical protein ABS771_20050 [Methylobacterium brachiatum]|uniref:Uncharacterized protein n=1 Tax=Methylobacterium brachiatum TaxID=269660 RepID=A0ABV1R4U5_9HYPH